MVCKYCGAVISDDLTVCPFCNAVLSGSSSESSEDEQISNDEAQKAIEPDNVEKSADEVENNFPAEGSLSDPGSGAVSDTVIGNDTDDSPSKRTRFAKKSKILNVILAVLLLAALIALLFLSVDGLGAKITKVYKDLFSAGDGNAVVAEYGDHKLTNQELAYYYYELYDYYSPYLSAVLDTSIPLSEQNYTDGVTWQEYFIKTAIDSWKSTTVLSDKAKSENYELTDEDKEELASVDEKLQQTAETAGFKTVDAYLKDHFGRFSTVDSYKQYNSNEIYAFSYYRATYNDFLDAVSADNTPDENNYNVSVRHILIKPEDTDNEESVKAAEEKANSIYSEWKSGEAIEDSFAALASEHSEDPGSKSEGGLYDNVYEGQMVTAFNDWCFDKSRKHGDSGIVKTEYGYHIMYFVDRVAEDPSEKAYESIEQWLMDLLNEVTVTTHIEKAEID
ncbi:MAG: peptidylprolyl isomerase [Clostridia bacterium]|nr:peptidylprolyl isomerase [Clostridia bacterium]